MVLMQKSIERVKSHNKKTTTMDSPVYDWLTCLIIWGSRNPKQSSEEYKQHPKGRWKLCGYSGYYGPSHFVPVKVAVCALREFSRRHQDDLEKFDCYETLSQILSLLERVGDTVTYQKEQMEEKYRNGSVKQGMFLLPLSCGHNGAMSSAEEKTLLQHLQRAKWLQA
mmetsp:Transcript_30471/g.37697  ORF Transcript_30471/g.37697 Transcript_30471/m.37697 type:complete len:167 (-) Transcript_30471:228-728(-)